jgi:hypothetical protein
VIRHPWLTESKRGSDTLGIPKTSHSFTHSVRDLLRDAGVSEEVAKTLLGYGSRSIGDQYGQGVLTSSAKGGHGEGPRSPPVISMESGAGKYFVPRIKFEDRNPEFDLS